MKQVLFYLALSGLVHGVTWAGVLPAVVDIFDADLEAGLHDEAVEPLVDDLPLAVVYVEEEIEEEEEEEIEPEPEITAPEPEPEPVEPEVVEAEPEVVQPEPEPEREPEREREVVEPEPEPEPEPVREPPTEDDERIASPEPAAGGSVAAPAAVDAAAPPQQPGTGGAGKGTGQSVGDGSRDDGPRNVVVKTIDRDKLLRGYQRDLAKIFQAHKVYPKRARRQGIEGEVVVEVVVDAHGTIISYRVIESSGHAPLDQAALEAVANIGKLPAPPSELQWTERKLRIP